MNVFYPPRRVNANENGGKERDMERTLTQLGEIGIIPVIKIDNPSLAAPLAAALAEGGLPCAEITFRTEAAGEALANIAKARPDMILGAGTVLTVDQAKKAVDSGARFIVSPGFSPAVVDWCQKNGIPVIPGVSTPTEIQACLERGLREIKFFPAEALGGTEMLDALSGPFPHVSFIPSGGIERGNLASYAKKRNVLAVGGSWMVKPALIEAKDWEAVTALTVEAVRTLHGFSLAHVGVNASNPVEAEKIAEDFSIFGFTGKDGEKSRFLDDAIEVMKTPGRGAKGHIALTCANIERALAYLAKKGIHGIPETAQKANGALSVIYLDREIGAFAVHLLRAK